MDARCFTVGPIAENCWIVRRERSRSALVIDPGDEADRLLAAIEALGVTVEAILITHCHFDHIGAVAAVARGTGAPVYCPRAEVPMLRDPNAFTWPEFGPFEGYEPEETLAGAERLELAGLEIDVIATPGHSPGHLTYSIPAERAILSGDVLFAGSIGRADLPGADAATLLGSIAALLDALPADTQVLPGHMGVTTLGRERASNPFLRELATQ
jgi:hydroxyacylglutathione hydrolase